MQQVKEALRLMIDIGDQPPTVREVVADLAVNPNTVAKAYRDLEHEGLPSRAPGPRHVRVVARSLRPPFATTLRAPASNAGSKAETAGPDEESIAR